MKKWYQQPIFLKGERAWRTYLGGRELNRQEGIENPQDDHYPEEWMFSTTEAISGDQAKIEGLCRLSAEPELTLRDVIEEYPDYMLGKAHVESFGATPGLLIKKIDSAERLTVQVHPDNVLAQKLFNSQFGKTECWYILNTRESDQEPPCIYLGFRPGVTEKDWRECFKQQDYPRMLAMMNCLPVKAGETYLVCGGVPHAIGAGCFLIEIQQPTDYTIRMERVTPSGYKIDDNLCHQGIGFEKMFQCFLYEGEDETDTRKHWCLPAKKLEGILPGKSLVSYSDTNCFAMDRLELQEEHVLGATGTFYCLYVLDGQGSIFIQGIEQPLQVNSQLFISAVCEDFKIISDTEKPLVILRFKGPELKVDLLT